MLKLSVTSLYLIRRQLHTKHFRHRKKNTYSNLLVRRFPCLFLISFSSTQMTFLCVRFTQQTIDVTLFGNYPSPFIHWNTHNIINKTISLNSLRKDDRFKEHNNNVFNLNYNYMNELLFNCSLSRTCVDVDNISLIKSVLAEGLNAFR